MRRLTLSQGILLAAALFSLTGCGKKDMESRKGPVKDFPNASATDRLDSPLTVPGFSNFELTPVMDSQQLSEMYSLLRTDLTTDPWNLCSERAHVWAYQLWKAKGVESGKVFLFYTVSEYRDAQGRTRLRVNTGNPVGRSWIWHAAPYVATVNGDLFALENFAGVKRPMHLKDWLRYQSNGAECVELKGTEDEKPLMKYTCGPITADGQCTRNAPGMIKVPEGGPKCYFRRVPSYYVYPRDVANHDYLELPPLNEWNERKVYSLCSMAMGGQSDERRQKCMELLGDAADATVNALTSEETFEVPPYAKAQYSSEDSSSKE